MLVLCKSFQSFFKILSMSMKIIDPVLISLIFCHPTYGQNVNEITFRRNTIQRKRSQARKLMATNIRNNFKPPQRCIVHLDGNIMTDNCRISGDILALICAI